LSLHVSFVLHAKFKRERRPFGVWLRHNVFEDGGDKLWDRIFDDYPVLHPRFAQIDRSIRAAFNEFAMRFAHDLPRISADLSIGQASAISDVEVGLSDPHNCGRTVIRVTFDSGHCVIYKPKNLFLDEEWLCFVTALGMTEIVCPKVVTGTNYGWTEYIPAETSVLSNAAETAYGKLLSLLWLFNSTDMHRDNTILAPGGVALVDFETLLSAPFRLARDHRLYWRNHNISTTLFASADISRWSSHFRSAALSRLSVTDRNTHGSRFVFDSDDVRLLSNAQLRRANTVIHTEFGQKNANNILEAFRSSCAAIDRDTLLDFIERVKAFSDFRFVARNTSDYYALIERLSLPRFLRSRAAFDGEREAMMERARVFDTEHFSAEPVTGALVADEMQQIDRGDVPIFRFRGDSVEIETSEGRNIEFFSIPASEYCRSKISSFGESDVDEQADLLAIACGHPKAHFRGRDVLLRGFPQRHVSDLDNNLAALTELIVASAHHPHGGAARWMTSSNGGWGEGDFAVFGNMSAFSGSLGICLALEATLRVVPNLDRALVSGILDSEAGFLADKIERDWNSDDDVFSFGLEGIAGNLFVSEVLLDINPSRWSFLERLSDLILERYNGAPQEGVDFDVDSGIAGDFIALSRLTCGRLRAAHGRVSPAFIKAALDRLEHEIEVDTLARTASPKGGEPLHLGASHG